MCLVFISLQAALSHSLRAFSLFLLHHFSYCGYLFAVDGRRADSGQMNRAKDSYYVDALRKNDTRWISNIPSCNNKSESLSRAAARTELRI